MRSSTNPVTVCSEERVGGGGGGHTRGGGTDAATQDHICTRYAWYVGTHACIDACMRVYVYDCVCVYAYVSAIVKDVYMYRLFDCTNVLYRHICAFTHTYTQLHMLMFTVSVYMYGVCKYVRICTCRELHKHIDVVYIYISTHFSLSAYKHIHTHVSVDVSLFLFAACRPEPRPVLCSICSCSGSPTAFVQHIFEPNAVSVAFPRAPPAVNYNVGRTIFPLFAKL